MKFSRLHKILFVAVGIIAGVFIACNEWDYIDQPETVYLNEEVKVTARLRIEPSTNYDSRLIFGIYAPKSLDLKNNATLIFNTENIAEVLGVDYPQAVDIKNEKLTPIDMASAAPDAGGKTYTEAFMEHFGVGENASLGIEMEWVAWESKIQTYISDKLAGDAAHNQHFFATVDITFNAGPEELECYLGYASLNAVKGFNTQDEQFSPQMFKHFVVDTYEAPALPTLTMVQSVYRFGDIFGMEFSDTATALEGESDIYICGRATLTTGEVIEVTEAVDANRLQPISRRLPNGEYQYLFEKYIYPPFMFNLADGQKIDALTIWFINADGSKVVTESYDGVAFVLEQTPGSIHDVEEPEMPEEPETPEEPEEGGEETPEEGGDAPVEA